MATWQPVETILCDLDDTLYRNPEVAELMKQNIQKYMVEKLKVPEEGLETRGKGFYMDYGTSLAGLRVQGYAVDYDDWHAVVHGTLPYDRLFHRDPELRRMLESLPPRRFIFTNADIKHAEKVLNILGIRDLFKDIVCFETIMDAANKKGINSESRPVTCKPSAEAFQLALEQAGAKPETTLFLDDSLRNVVGASNQGIRAVLIGDKRSDTPAIATIETIHDLPRALPVLWSEQATLRMDPHLCLQPVSNTEVQVLAQ